ncbi:MAG: hypothetical protein CMM53_06240 [Rhodospirillaceae bacterium]|nr:hypothetical protein [Rhodospirillaceae bacterium]|tara:strand:+ start:456 stop:782 length:327 start_codon:yes stop_codon:yes gene_type:complete
MLIKRILGFIFLSLVMITPVQSQTLQTNIEGVVLKKVRCTFYGNVFFTISNRSSSPIRSTLYVTVFDQDGDPVGNGSRKINLGGVSGKSSSISSVNCDKSSRFAFKFQ